MICTVNQFPEAIGIFFSYPPILYFWVSVIASGVFIMMPMIYYAGYRMPQSLRDRFKEAGLWNKFPDIGLLFLGPNHYMAMVYGIDVVLKIPNRWYNKNFNIRKEAPKDYLNLLRILGLMILIVYPVFLLIVVTMAVGRVLCWLQ